MSEFGRKIRPNHDPETPAEKAYSELKTEAGEQEFKELFKNINLQEIVDNAERKENVEKLVAYNELLRNEKKRAKVEISYLFSFFSYLEDLLTKNRVSKSTSFSELQSYIRMEMYKFSIKKKPSLDGIKNLLKSLSKYLSSLEKEKATQINNVEDVLKVMKDDLQYLKQSVGEKTYGKK